MTISPRWGYHGCRSYGATCIIPLGEGWHAERDGVGSYYDDAPILHFHGIHGAHYDCRSALSWEGGITDHCIVFDGSDVFGEIE